MKFKYQVIILSVILSIFCFMFFQCTTKVEPNPNPGVVRLYLVTNPADTCIQIGFDSLTVSEDDFFVLIISQMKAYTNEINYTHLYKDFTGYQDEDMWYNLLDRDQGSYVPQLISETYIAPNSYNKIEFVLYP